MAHGRTDIGIEAHAARKTLRFRDSAPSITGLHRRFASREEDEQSTNNESWQRKEMFSSCIAFQRMLHVAFKLRRSQLFAWKGRRFTPSRRRCA